MPSLLDSSSVRRQLEDKLSKRPRKVFTLAMGYSSADLAQFGWDHLFAARVLFQSGIPCLDSAGYLAQLGLELLLKTLLLDLNGEFPDEHRLQELWRMIQERRPGFQLNQSHADVFPCLDRYYGLRYPGPNNKLQGISANDWPVIREIAEYIRAEFPPILQEVTDSQHATKKGGRDIIRREGKTDE